MTTIPAKVRTGHDGRFNLLSIPTGIPDAELDVLVVLDNPENATKLKDEWPDGYFERTFGSLKDVGLERHEQGEYEEWVPFD